MAAIKPGRFECISDSSFVLKLIIILFVISSIKLYAQTASDSTETSVSNQINIKEVSPAGVGNALFRTVTALIFIVAVAYLGMWGMKQLFFKTQKYRGIPIRVVGSTFLSPKKGIYLVDSDEKRLV